MSFFYDVLNYFDLNIDDKFELISYIPNVGVVVFGDFKIGGFSSSEITLINKNKKIIFIGKDLKITNMCKGEIVIRGKIEIINNGE